MTLLDWKSHPRLLMNDVKLILLAEGKGVITPSDCIEWARAFIRRYEPSWQPGDDLEFETWRLIGGSFERQVARARRQLRKAKRL